MVIIVTGASHTGKTLLAQRLIEKYKYLCLSEDHLKMGLIRSGNTCLTPESDDDGLTEYLWPIVREIAREIVKTAVENGQDLTVEGCYIPFDCADDFGPGYIENIRRICLVMSERYIKTHFGDIKKYADVIESRLDDSRLTPESLLADNARFSERARRCGAEICLIDGEYNVNPDIRKMLWR